MGLHAKIHPINDTSDHSAGTNGTLLGTESSAIAEKAFSTTAVANNIVQRNASADVIVPTTPSSAAAAASKQYVDSSAAGHAYKNPARAATTAALAAVTYANGTAGVGATLTADANGAIAAQDGITLVLNNRLLVKNQAAGLQNGPYFVSQVGTAGTPFILTRVTDADEAADLSQATLFIAEGTVNADKQFTQTADSITVGTTALVFVQSDAGAVTAGNGLTKSGNTISAVDDATGGANLSRSVNVSANGLAVKVDDSSIEEGASSRLRVKDAGITLAKLADQKALITLAGATPVLADLTTLTASGHWAFAKGTTNRVFLCQAIDAGGLKKFAVESGEITA